MSIFSTLLTDAPVRRVEKIDIVQGKKLMGKPKMTWMEVVKKDMKLLKLEERMVADRGEGSMYWIEYKLFVFLGSYSRPHIIGIKAGWFGLVWFGFVCVCVCVCVCIYIYKLMVYSLWTGV